MPVILEEIEFVAHESYFAVDLDSLQFTLSGQDVIYDDANRSTSAPSEEELFSILKQADLSETPLHATLDGNVIDYRVCEVREGNYGSFFEVGPRPVLAIAMLSFSGQATIGTNVVVPGSLVLSGLPLHSCTAQL